jgi:hypothetical protein
MVNGTHDVTDNSLGRVIDAAQFTNFGVVGSQKSLVEMQLGRAWPFPRQNLSEPCPSPRD